MPLSPKHAAFVREFLVDSNATQAAIRAGYTVRSSRVTGCRLLAHPAISVAIANGQQRRENKAIATREERQAFWSALMNGEGASLKWQDRLKASELLGKSQADFTDRVEHQGAIYIVTDAGAGFDR